MKKETIYFGLVVISLLVSLSVVIFLCLEESNIIVNTIESVEIESNDTEDIQELYDELEASQTLIKSNEVGNVDIERIEDEQQKAIAKQTVVVKGISAERKSRNQIEICFEPLQDIEIDTYFLWRKEKKLGDESWTMIREIDGNMTDTICRVTDDLDTGEPKQYVYRVDVKPKDEEVYQGHPGKTVLASNILVCIDPGHFAGKNQVTGEAAYDYAEGDFTIKIGLALRDVLKEKYGIDAYMTREDGSITIDGYTDAGLDSKHISLRGAYAGERDSDLFISLHTNANNDNANGYPTCLQPVEINKTIVLANQIACEREDIINVGNSIGINVSQINYDKGISSSSEFEIADANEISEWTVAYNDRLNVGGAVKCRLGKNGDYYGVLKGANEAGIPGIIVEHGMHTVAALREKAKNSDLYELWAEADAYGIAYGFGFETNIQMKGDK